MITAHAHALTRVDLGAALAYDDGSGLDQMALTALDAQPLSRGCRGRCGKNRLLFCVP